MGHGRLGTPGLSRVARVLRGLHSTIGFAELGCLGYLWYCAVTRRRDRYLAGSVGVLAAEGAALAFARGCPLGIFQRRAGDDVPMFELWFGPTFAPYAIPVFTVVGVAGLVALLVRPPSSESPSQPSRTSHGLSDKTW